MKIKLAYLISTLDGGGAERQLINDINAIDLTKFDVKIFVLKNQISIASQINRDVQIEVLNVNTYYNPLGVYSALRQIKKYNPDILHSIMYASNLISRFYKARYHSVKVINHIHGLGSWIRNRHLILDRLFLDFVDKIIVVSKKSKQLRLEREKYPEQLVTVLYNAIDTDKYKPVKLNLRRSLTLGTASRLIPLKQIHLAIELVNFCLQNGFDIHFKIAGIGREEERLKALVQKLKIGHKVHFLSFVDDMPGFYNEIDCFILCSRTEDLPMTIIESFSSGLRVIAPNIGGIEELLDGREGLLTKSFEDESDKKLLLEYLKTIKGKAYSSKNRKFAKENFDQIARMEKLEGLYLSLVS